jgi:hypothetical protein
LAAHSTFRPRRRAIASLKDAVKLSTFFPSVPLMSSPPPPTGCAAPMLVPGAIAATCAASVMKTPADPAPAPLGATHTITGSGAFRISFTITCMEGRSPPGVSSSMTSAGTPSRSARTTDSCTKLATAGLIGPSMTMRASEDPAWGSSAPLAGSASRTSASAAASLTRGHRRCRAPA